MIEMMSCLCLRYQLWLRANKALKVRSNPSRFQTSVLGVLPQCCHREAIPVEAYHANTTA